ncbi:hypothetical protein ASC89_01600 [Devosia sp. Root413D1]|uniref:DUF167 family protein n=1 Tax=unclassified Devosia TaxID=196773 RepID=UPI00070119FA|nr:MULTISPECIES: DUF167 family protein [unclassified Devosia]KQV09369.1 hypothetical protein ASC68_03470 [Devosia sp. Root105]KQW85797.1 hypothetical protein ASC89_01600 [Devosia sp. Root413D1]
MKPAFELLPDGIRLHLRVTPNAGLDRIDGFETRDDGATVLRMRVKAVPDKGKANAAVLVLLAKALGVPKSAVTLIAGDTARLKTLYIAGNPDALAAALAKLG